MAAYVAVGGIICLLNLIHPVPEHLSDFLYYLVCAVVATLGLKLTANNNAIPVGFLMILLAIEDLSLPELLFIACVVSVLGELQANGRRLPRLVPLLSSVGSRSIGIAAAQAVHQWTARTPYNVLFPTPMLAGSLVLLVNWGVARTLLTDRTGSLAEAFVEECRPLLPWFVGMAYMAYMVSSAATQSGINPGLVTLPVLFALDAAFRAWFDSKAKHREELAELQKRSLDKLGALHQRTLETLAVAIDGRDHSTHMHLRRVQFYVRAVGQELKLSTEQLEHLNVAALLHDIGKLGIPDHILLKPGGLSPEEWEKMRTHPVSGAQMLARMNFPDAVLEIVAAHHEKWDGSGYPRGLSGEEVPLGARILSAVDCLDALASDRPYRRALPIDAAMAQVLKEEGSSFDPLVVNVLRRRYVELEHQAWGDVSDPSAPLYAEPSGKDLGNLAATLHNDSQAAPRSIVDPIVSARQETQWLQSLASALTRALDAGEVTSTIHEQVQQMIAHDTLAIYVRRGDHLEPIGIVGENSNLFAREAFPIMTGLSARVVEHGVPILNGDPCLEGGYFNDSVVYKLQSAVAVPLAGPRGLSGVLTLYHADRNGFSRDHLRLLESIGQQIAPAIEGALRYRDTEKLSVTDHLTGVPNARSLELHLERELSRASREDAAIGVLVCDLNGFKQVNDRFGHLKGNEVLQAVAKGLQEFCRKSDYVARMGGDEFVMVVPGLREELRQAYMDRLNAVAEAAGWKVCKEECLSMSVGTAIYPIDGSEAKVLLAAADSRMYAAKQQSRRQAIPLQEVS